MEPRLEAKCKVAFYCNCLFHEHNYDKSFNIFNSIVLFYVHFISD